MPDMCSSPRILKDDFVRCIICGKKLFKVKYGGGVIVIICRGCHKEVTVPFGEIADKDGSQIITKQ